MRLRIWQRLEYYDPKGLLIALREMAATLPLSEMPYNISSLRTNQLNQYRQGRQCALFCYAISQLLGLEVRFAIQESSDIDFVGRYVLGDEIQFVPIQIKEFVPSTVNEHTSLQAEIDKLQKYADSKDLVVAFHLNRAGTILLSELDFSKVPIKELWFFGATSEDGTDWVLIGNLLSPGASFFNFKYPLV